MKEFIEMIIALDIPVFNPKTGEIMDYNDVAEHFGVDLSEKEDD